MSGNGQIGIPEAIREADRLAPGDAFTLERLVPGSYLLTKITFNEPAFTLITGEDGLPLIRTRGGAITSQLVKELDSLSQ